MHPRELPRRGFGTNEGRAAFIHAVAHIEFNAIDLAWDAAYRFRGMPREFYADWVSVADDEARHFALLRERLQQLGHDYGDFDAHNGLWEMAEKTAHDGLARMALVPRVLEARGLDVTPGMIAKLRSLGDEATVAHPGGHPARGSRARRRRFALVPLVLRARRAWIPRRASANCCANTRGGVLHGPFNTEARLAAGFDADELQTLQAEAAADRYFADALSRSAFSNHRSLAPA